MKTNEEQFEGALRERLRSAFASIHADRTLSDSIRTKLRAETARQRRRARARRLAWRLVPLAAAAAVVITAIGLFVGSGRTDTATAATMELHRIHQENLAGGPGFLRTDDPKQIEAHFKRELGFVPRVHRSEGAVQLIGFRIASFQGQAVANYMVKGKAGEISIIVTKGHPKALGLCCDCGHQGCSCFHEGRCKDCTIVGVQIGGRSYCAVGNVSKKDLQDVLALLRPEKR